MGACMSSDALKVTIDDGKSKKVMYITLKRMKTFRTLGDFLTFVGFSSDEQRDIYRTDTRPMEILERFSAFKIQNMIVANKKVKVTRLY